MILFVTATTHERRPILARDRAHELLLRGWKHAASWIVGPYVILPDHLHLFCAPRDPEMPFRSWVRFWKSWVSRRWPWPDEQPIWQDDVWDRQLRRGEDFAAKWDYVRGNPVRHGLVNTPEEWPYAGEIDVLHWHDP